MFLAIVSKLYTSRFFTRMIMFCYDISCIVFCMCVKKVAEKIIGKSVREKSCYTSIKNCEHRKYVS